jgi:peptide/nickel transport system permease protein
LLVFSLYLPSYPIVAWTNINDGLGANLRDTLLPALALSIPVAATFCRFVRQAAEDILDDAEYVRTAKAKGASRMRILLSHVLPNAVVPLTTVTGLQFGYLIGGSVLIEQVFALPGVGSRLMQGIISRDYPVVQAGVLLLALVFVLVTFIVDLIHPLLDPRIKTVRGRL